MGWSHPDEDTRADRYRDERKHDFPLRLERKITTAEEITLAVRGLRNIADAAALIDQYAAMRVAIALADDTERRLAALDGPLVR